MAECEVSILESVRGLYEEDETVLGALNPRMFECLRNGCPDKGIQGQKNLDSIRMLTAEGPNKGFVARKCAN